MNPINIDNLGEAGAELDSLPKLWAVGVFFACLDPCELSADGSLVSFTNNVYPGEGLWFLFFFSQEKL